ncbi:hydrolase 2, exosortase A system-associated [Paucibacter sp. B2R-40]|uniref:hydrolase 2, exosortase A system-associated n=1 Tax=Paucibacter sp. B2R-40 TaxID=2893554 RepID=UPI0021E49593|nr:hydrolase 2, exosortase A system-associated [Paucibacter sp. B2R-40]MCV2355507.1 hydrolase 2, exosortase A system-associated [Paucibacter sp. B2R-40]
MTPAPHAFFLPARPPSLGQRFCIFHAASDGPVRGRVVYIHPFAEEMNKSRRMAALQSRALATAGFSVLQIDLYGCGDSSGEFGDAGWDDWVTDVMLAVDWLSERDTAHAEAPLWLWGLRAGCLIACQAATKLKVPSNFCFWQPAISGKLILQQFLRLKLAADMLGGNSKGMMDEMKRALAQGQALEIAGYSLSAALATGLENATLSPPGFVASPATMAAANTSNIARVEWFELSQRADAKLTPATEQGLKNWQAATAQVRHSWVHGPSFWQTQEIEEAPELLAMTTTALQPLSAAVSMPSPASGA